MTLLENLAKALKENPGQNFFLQFTQTGDRECQAGPLLPAPYEGRGDMNETIFIPYKFITLFEKYRGRRKPGRVIKQLRRMVPSFKRRAR